MSKEGMHEFQTINLYYRAHIEVGIACGSRHTALWCWQQDMERFCRCRRRQQDRCREFETESARRKENGNDDKRTTLKQAASQCVTTEQQSLLYLELGDSQSDGCSGPTTGNLVSYAVGIGGKVAGD